MLKRWVLILCCQTAATSRFISKLWSADRLRRLWHLLLIFHSSLLYTGPGSVSWADLWWCDSCFTRLFYFFVLWVNSSSGWGLIISSLFGVKHVLGCSRHINTCATTWHILIMSTNHLVKRSCVCFGKVFVERHRLMSSLILRKGWSSIITSRSGLTLARLCGHLAVTIKRWGQCSAILSKSTISM